MIQITYNNYYKHYEITLSRRATHSELNRIYEALSAGHRAGALMFGDRLDWSAKTI